MKQFYFQKIRVFYEFTFKKTKVFTLNPLNLIVTKKCEIINLGTVFQKIITSIDEKSSLPTPTIIRLKGNSQAFMMANLV